MLPGWTAITAETHGEDFYMISYNYARVPNVRGGKGSC